MFYLVFATQLFATFAGFPVPSCRLKSPSLPPTEGIQTILIIASRQFIPSRSSEGLLAELDKLPQLPQLPPLPPLPQLSPPSICPISLYIWKQGTFKPIFVIKLKIKSKQTPLIQ